MIAMAGLKHHMLSRVLGMTCVSVCAVVDTSGMFISLLPARKFFEDADHSALRPTGGNKEVFDVDVSRESDVERCKHTSAQLLDFKDISSVQPHLWSSQVGSQKTGRHFWLETPDVEFCRTVRGRSWPSRVAVIVGFSPAGADHC